MLLFIIQNDEKDVIITILLLFSNVAFKLLSKVISRTNINESFILEE